MSENTFGRALGRVLNAGGLSQATDTDGCELLASLLACSETLGGALVRSTRFARLVAPELRLSLAVDAHRATLAVAVLHQDRRPEAMERLVASLGRFARRLTGTPLPVLEVRFAHGPRASRTAYARLFGTSAVHFARPHDALVFDSALLGVRLPGDDERACRALERRALALLEAMPPQPELLREVREAMLDGLSRGNPSADTVAHKLGVHPKTLSRRLRAMGLTHRRLLDQIRYQLADRYLRDRTHSVREIALLLGFFDTSSFNRACKRWTGRAPHYHRVDLASEAYP